MFREGIIMKKKYVLRNKRRFMAFIILLTMVLISTGFIVNAGTANHVRPVYEIVRIAKGDTLWEIASRYAWNSDPRSYIYEIKELNHLDGDTIYEGQELYLPE
jgi:LysM repeat protein